MAVEKGKARKRKHNTHTGDATHVGVAGAGGDRVQDRAGADGAGGGGLGGSARDGTRGLRHRARHLRGRDVLDVGQHLRGQGPVLGDQVGGGLGNVKDGRVLLVPVDPVHSRLGRDKDGRVGVARGRGDGVRGGRQDLVARDGLLSLRGDDGLLRQGSVRGDDGLLGQGSVEERGGLERVPEVVLGVLERADEVVLVVL